MLIAINSLKYISFFQHALVLVDGSLLTNKMTSLLFTLKMNDVENKRGEPLIC